MEHPGAQGLRTDTSLMKDPWTTSSYKPLSLQHLTLCSVTETLFPGIIYLECAPYDPVTCSSLLPPTSDHLRHSPGSLV